MDIDFEKDDELDNRESACIDIALDNGFVLPVPEAMLQERMELMYLTKEEAVEDVRHLATGFCRCFLAEEVFSPSFTQKILDHLNSEASTYRILR